MYNNKLIACVKADGKVLRENGEEVLLPFGSEYSLYFKNENSRKVQIEVEIDGQDIMNGKALLLDAGESMDLDGYIKDIQGNDNRAFKFITKTSEISDFRGDRAEDGLIKVSYTFEKERPTLIASFDQFDYQRVYTNCGDSSKHPFEDSLNNVSLGHIFDVDEAGSNNNIYSNSISNSVDNSMEVSYSSNNATMRSMSNGIANASVSKSISDEPGITVEGSATGQTFRRGHIGALENKSHTMVFNLKGLTDVEQVQEPVTVKTKKQCPSCGKKYKSSFEYCPKDGTFLRFP